MGRRAITGARLWDGLATEPQPGQTIVWDADLITWVGPDGEVDLDDAEVTRAQGGTVAPGLIDCHVHVTLDSGTLDVDRVAHEPTALVAIRAARNAGRLLEAGITSARDVGSRDGIAIEVGAAQRQGWLPAARLLAAGRGITPTGGHGWMIGVEADGPEGVRRAVRAEVARGADLIKLFVTGGVMGSGSHALRAMMTAEEVEAAVEEAHRRGRKVAAHVHGSEGVGMALEAGVDTIEHGTALTEGQAREMASSGAALVPTLAAGVALVEHQEALPPDLLARMEEVEAILRNSVRMAIERGVRVLAGTDAGTPFNPPGTLPTEIGLLAGLGLGPHGALRAATSLAADTLGLKDAGTLEPGKLADLVLFEGDPFEDLEHLFSPRLVVQAGA